MRACRRVSCLAGLALLAACASPGSEASKPAALPEVTTDTRVSVGDCAVLFDGEKTDEFGFLGALLPIFAPALISNGIDLLAGYLAERGADKPFTATAHANLEMQVKSNWQCIHFIRGRFLLDRTAASSPAAFTQDEKKRFEANRIALSGEPDFFLEMRIVWSVGRSAWTLIPTFLQYNRTIESAAADAGGRGIAMVVSFHPPGTAASDKDARTATISFGDLPTGTVRHFPMPKLKNPADIRTSEQATWAAFEPSSLGAVDYSAWSPTFMRPASEATGFPLILSGVLTETRRGSEIAKFLAGVLRGSKAPLQAELEKLVIPEKREAAQLADLTSQVNADKDVKEATADFKVARLNYCASPSGDALGDRTERLNKAKAVATAQAKLAIAAAKTGASVPAALNDISDAVATRDAFCSSP